LRDWCSSVVRTLVLLLAVALALPVAAAAKLQGDLRVCGLSSCRVVDRHRGHEIWPLVADLSHGRKVGPPALAPFYRLSVLQLDSNGHASAALEAEPMYLVRGGAVVTRTGDGWGGVAWTRLWVMPAAVARAVRELRPFPAPMLVGVIVGDRRVGSDPNSYLRLFRLRAPARAIPDPAGPRPLIGDAPSTLAYGDRLERHWIPVYLTSARRSPWSDGESRLWIGRRLDLIMRDGEIVRIPHALAERVRRSESLR
jgi:hypothetical protein